MSGCSAPVKGAEHPRGAGYLWLQQLPGQQEDCRQQLWPQQEPGQHFAFLAQQAAPVAARAESENSDAATMAKILVFMEISSRSGRDVVRARRGEDADCERDLDAEIVFEAENRRAAAEAGGEFADAGWGGLRGDFAGGGGLADGRSLGGVAGVGFLECLLRALHGRALGVVAGARAAGHVVALAVHGGRDGGIRGGKGDEPERGKSDGEPLPHRFVAGRDHE